MAKKKILLIEDEEFIIRPLEIILKKEDFDLVIAKDGEDGLLKIKNEKPDLVLLDIVLPKMNGFEVLEKFKKERDLKDIPVIILSNLAREGEVERGLSLGAKDYFVKTNFSLFNLIRKIKNYL